MQITRIFSTILNSFLAILIVGCAIAVSTKPQPNIYRNSWTIDKKHEVIWECSNSHREPPTVPMYKIIDKDKSISYYQGNCYQI